MNSIQTRWEEYRATMPARLTTSEIVEARLGFFSGAASIYFMMMNKAMDMEVTQEEGEKFLETLGAEIEQFMKNIRSSKDILAEDLKNAR